eukprot:83284-Amphidinium_carterae.1
MGTKHIAVSVLEEHSELVGLGRDSGSYQRRHHTQSANSIWRMTISTLLSTVFAIPPRFQGLNDTSQHRHPYPTLVMCSRGYSFRVKDTGDGDQSPDGDMDMLHGSAYQSNI